MAGAKAVKAYDIVGLTQLGDSNFGGAGIAQMTLPEAQRVTDRVGKFDQISVAAAEGVSAVELRDRIAEILPPNLIAETGEQAAQRQSDDIASDLGFLRIALLVFAGISLFVGAFQIFNTFSITVAQRTREFGMLRTLGASRGQILSSVGIEALVLGHSRRGRRACGRDPVRRRHQRALQGDRCGPAQHGHGRARPHGDRLAADRGRGHAGRSARARAARHAHHADGGPARVRAAGLEAARAPDAHRRAPARRARARLMLIGLFGGIEESGTAAGLLGGGAALILFATSLFSPRLVRPLASLAGKPMERVRGLTGRLARENAMRKPGRTATTAAALMIGLALVTFVTVFAAGLKSSIANTIDENFKSDVILQNTDGFSPIPARSGGGRQRRRRRREHLRRSPTDRASTRASRSASPGSTRRRSTASCRSTSWRARPQSCAGSSDREAVADEAWADSKGLEVGDTVSVRTPLEKRAIYTIRGEIEGGLDLFGKMLVNDATLQPLFGADQPSLAFVRLEHGASAATVQSDLEAALAARYPTVEVQNQEQLKENQESQVNALLLLVYALLSLAVIVSLFGIVNTLALSIHERTRELGMLRAVGMSRRQVRTMVRYEAVITALIGAILGMVLGVLMAALVSRPLADEGFTLSYPIATLILLLALAALAGVVAAIGPARRASRIDVLRALAYE